MRRFDTCLYLCPADRAELLALLINRNTPRKLALCADIVRATAQVQVQVQVQGLAAAAAVLDGQIGRPGLDETAAYRIHRDYGMNDRAQAPQ